MTQPDARDLHRAARGGDIRADAVVIVVSDRSAAGMRADSTGPAVSAWLRERGTGATVTVIPDEKAAIAGAVTDAVARARLVVLAGGTGLGPRDVTPQAVRPLLDYEVPGLAEAMRAEGRRSTPLAALSRSLAGVVGRSLVLALPGSPRGALESLDANFARPAGRYEKGGCRPAAYRRVRCD